MTGRRTKGANGIKADAFKVVEFGFLVPRDSAEADLQMQQLAMHAPAALMYWMDERPASMDDIVSYRESMEVE